MLNLKISTLILVSTIITSSFAFAEEVEDTTNSASSINIKVKKKKSDILLEEYANKLKKNSKDIKTYLLRADFYYKKNNFDLAITDLKSILKIDKTNKDSKLILENILKIEELSEELKSEVSTFLEDLNSELEKEKQKKEALIITSNQEPYSEKIKKNPEDKENYLLRGKFYYKEKSIKLAITDFKKVLELDKENKEAKLALKSIIKDLSLDSSIKNNSELQKLIKDIKVEENTTKKENEIDFSKVVLSNIKNQDKINLSSLKGKVVLVNFWATWCGPCKDEIPSFTYLYDKYKADGLEIIGISIDKIKESEVLSFAEELKVNYPVVMNNKSASKAFGDLEIVPTSFLIDTEGKVVKVFVGIYPKKTFEKEVYKLLDI